MSPLAVRPTPRRPSAARGGSGAKRTARLLGPLDAADLIEHRLRGNRTFPPSDSPPRWTPPARPPESCLDCAPARGDAAVPADTAPARGRSIAERRTARLRCVLDDTDCAKHRQRWAAAADLDGPARLPAPGPTDRVAAGGRSATSGASADPRRRLRAAYRCHPRDPQPSRQLDGSTARRLAAPRRQRSATQSPRGQRPATQHRPEVGHHRAVHREVAGCSVRRPPYTASPAGRTGLLAGVFVPARQSPEMSQHAMMAWYQNNIEMIT